MRKVRIKTTGFMPYLITEDGEVYSDWGRNKGHKMSIYQSSSGYAKCTLQTTKRESCPVLMHRLMAEAFIPNPDNKPHVNHINSDRMDYSLPNLEWCTVSENIQHGLKYGNIPTGHECSFATMTEEQVLTAYGRMLEGQRTIDIARDMDIDRRVLVNLKAKKCYLNLIGHLPDIKRRHMNKPLAKETVLWVANRVSEGLSPKQVSDLSKNKLVTPHMVSRIKRRECFASLTSDFEW